MPFLILLLLAALIPPPCSAEAEVSLSPQAGWRVVYRKGVLRDSLTAAPTGARVHLEMDEGGYTELAPAQTPTIPFPAGDVLVAVAPSNGNAMLGQLGVRLADRDGEIFQAHARALPASGGVIRFRFPDEFPESWGPRANKQWDYPLRLQTLVVAGSQVDFRLGDLRFVPLPPKRLGWMRYEPARRAAIQYRSGVDSSTAADGNSARVTLQTTGHGYTEWSCEGFGRKMLDGADRVRLKLRVTQPLAGATLALRILDANNECFQAAGLARLNEAGERTVEVPLTPEAFHESWGSRKDGKIDFPVRLASVVFGADHPGSLAANLDEIAVRKEMSLSEGLALQFDTGTRFHLLPPGKPAQVTLSVANQLDAALSGKLQICFRDPWGRSTGESAQTLALASGAQQRFTLALPALRAGAYTGEFILTDADGHSEALDVPARFAVMRPNGPAKRRDGFLFSVCTHTERYGEQGLIDEPEAAGLLGIRIARTFPGWRQLNPRPGAPDFTQSDRMVEQYARNGVELQPIVSDTPDWALLHPDKPGGNQPPRPELFAAYGEALARHYRGKLHYYEVWNEPDISFWLGTVDEYIANYKAVAAGIRAGDPNARVMTGGFVSPDRNPAFLKRFLGECGNLFDVFAIHMHGPFSYFEHGITTGLDPLLAGLGRKAPVYFNETAISSTLSGGELTQAQQLIKKLTYAMSRGAIGYTWYDLRNDGWDRSEPEHNYGLMTHDMQPKPNYVAYNTLIHYLGNATYLRRLESDPTVYLFAFRTPAGLVLVGWCDSPAAQGRVYALTSNAKSIALADHQGNETVAVKGGALLTTLDSDPRFFILQGASRVDTRLEPVAAQDLSAPVFAGTTGAAAIQIRNPLPRPIRGALTVGTTRLPFRAPAGRSARLLAPVRVPQSAANNYAVPVRLDLSPAGLPARSFSLPIFLSLPLDGTVIPLERSENIHNFYAADPRSPQMHWQGPNDLSLHLQVSTDAQALLITARVNDDVHCQEQAPTEMWRGDSLQVGILPPGAGTPLELGAALRQGKVIRACWGAPAGIDPAAAAAGFTADVERAGTQTTYRLRVPLALLHLQRADQQRGFALNVAVNDDDGRGRKGAVQLSPGLVESKSPERWFRFAQPSMSRSK